MKCQIICALIGAIAFGGAADAAESIKNVPPITMTPVTQPAPSATPAPSTGSSSGGSQAYTGCIYRSYMEWVDGNKVVLTLSISNAPSGLSFYENGMYLVGTRSAISLATYRVFEPIINQLLEASASRKSVKVTAEDGTHKVASVAVLWDTPC